MYFHKTSFHITSFSTKHPFYKTSINTKRPWIQNVLLFKTSTDTKRPWIQKRPFLQNVHRFKTSFTSLIILNNYTLPLRHHFGGKSIAEILHGKSAGLVPVFADFSKSTGNAFLVTHYYGACNILLPCL
jgi:hypothetical protein